MVKSIIRQVLFLFFFFFWLPLGLVVWPRFGDLIIIIIIIIIIIDTILRI